MVIVRRHLKLSRLVVTGAPLNEGGKARGLVRFGAHAKGGFRMAHHHTVHVEKRGIVTTVIIDRPHARNAVDRPTADALVAAFLAFENDANALVAVLCGAGGTFCAGADLKGVAEGRGNRLITPGSHFDPHAGDAPMGPSRMRLAK